MAMCAVVLDNLPEDGGRLGGPPSTEHGPLCTFGSDDVMARLAVP